MRADARRNRERIVVAAKEVFGLRGTDAQMDDVAATAGVGVGTVYRHFPTKDAILGELLRQKFEGIATELERARDEGGDAGEALLRAMKRSAMRVCNDAATQRMLTGEQRPAAWAVAADEYERMQTLTTDLIARGQQSGTLRADLQPTDIRIVMSGLTATMADPAVAHLWERHFDLVVDALRARRYDPNPPRG